MNSGTKNSEVRISQLAVNRADYTLGPSERDSCIVLRIPLHTVFTGCLLVFTVFTGCLLVFNVFTGYLEIDR